MKGEMDDAIQSVLLSTDFIGGSLVHEFETDLAAYPGAKHVVGCASGTDALQLEMMALRIGCGDEVIIVVHILWLRHSPVC
jgi:dTDP-4-amino-4,6-dideoxygalactose transaminase